jgi:hypothetical protein
MGAVSPQAAYDAQTHLGSMDDAARKHLGQQAAALLALPEDQRAQAYPAFAAEGRRLGIPVSDDYAAANVDGLSKLAQAFGGTNAPEQFTLSPGSKRFGPNGQVVAEVPFAPKAPTFVDVPDGRGGTIKMQTGESGLEPLQFGDGATNSGGMGYKPPPVDHGRAPTALEQRIALARSMGAKDEEIRSMVMGGSYGTAPVPGDPTQTGAAYLATLPPEMRPVVKAIAEGRQAPPSASSRSPQAQQILQAVYAYDQTANATNLPARTSTRKDFTSGKSYRNMMALNQVAAHLEQLAGQTGKVAGHSIPLIGNALNAAENAYDRASGETGIIDWESTADAVAHETRALFAGSGGGTLQELEGYLRTLSANNSEAQKKAAIRNIAALVRSRIGILNDAYKQGMGTTADPFQVAFPHAATALDSLSTGDDTNDAARRKALLDKY